MKRVILGLLAVAVFFTLSACDRQPYTSDFFAMDTFMRITAYGETAEEGVHAAEQMINELENEFSNTRENSLIFRLNHSGTAEISRDAGAVLSQAITVSEETGGAFDITIAAVSGLWGIGTEKARVPRDEELQNALQTVDYHNIQMEGTKVRLANGAQIDLGGIGKGYAADKAAEVLKAHGVEKAVLSLGGNVYVLGQKDEHTLWKVGIADPESPEQSMAVLSVQDTSVVTTGGYQRYMEKDGTVYHHVFDPATGYPAETDLLSVTVVHENSALADAYSTALFVLGAERGMAFCREHQVEACFVRKDHVVLVTDGLYDRMELLENNTEYHYEMDEKR